MRVKVTPYVGVWIETSVDTALASFAQSHPTWVCGLKLMCLKLWMRYLTSHPTWVCGLKLFGIIRMLAFVKSHPTWVCGLKLPCYWQLAIPDNVTPYVGVWIETSLLLATRHSR